MVHKITFEGRATKINVLADHTYVHPVGYGSDFKCWGSNQGPDNRKICSGTCVYEIADCYRCPVGSFPDTACIGAYAINGVCHQSANCFLYYSRVQLTTAVRGYWATVVKYGPYGTNFLVWLIKYNSCYQKYKSLSEEQPNGDDLFSKINAYYTQIAKQPPSNSHEHIVKTSEILTKHIVPDLDYSIIENLQREYLQDSDKVIEIYKEDIRQLTTKLDELSAKLQNTLAEKMDRADYQKLTGLEPGQISSLFEEEIIQKMEK